MEPTTKGFGRISIHSCLSDLALRVTQWLKDLGGNSYSGNLQSQSVENDPIQSRILWSYERQTQPELRSHFGMLHRTIHTLCLSEWQWYTRTRPQSRLQF